MRRRRSAAALVICGVAMGGATLWAQAPVLARGTRLEVELRTSLDSKHAQVGDLVKAVVTSAVKESGQVVLPKGTTLTGRVSEVAAAESSKSPSDLGIVFERVVLKSGATLAMDAAVAAVEAAPVAPVMPAVAARPEMPASEVSDGDGGGRENRGQQMGTLGSQDVNPQVTGTNSAITTLEQQRKASPIEVRAAGGAGSILSQAHGDLKLASGTRLQLAVF